jgi:predicted Zn-dependent peptidase
MTQPARDIERAELPNGLVVVTEKMPHVRSVSVGMWMGSGSRGEAPERNGMSHFIEHMVFKGTEHRSAEEIARSIDSIGGMLDAFTAKEMICFNAKVLDEHLPIAFEIISDLVLRPRFDDQDLGKEKQVVLEEIKMELDNPDYLVHELFTQGFWPDHALGRPILGTPETVRSFNRDSLFSCYRPWYAPDNMVLTAAGHLEHAHLVELAEKEFGRMPASGFSRRADAPSPQAPIRVEKKRDLEQVHICIGVPAYPMAHERRFAAAVLNNILGGGMSSRLFQKIREQQGLAYAVFSELSPYSDTGMLTIYAGTAGETAAKVVDMVAAEFRAIKESLVSEEELRRAKDHLKGSLMLSLESTSSRMSNLARQEMYFTRFYTLDELLVSIEEVTREELQSIAREFFRTDQIAVTVLGNLNGFSLTRDRLAC